MRISLTIILGLLLFACAGTPKIGASSKSLSDPSPISHPEVRKGATVMVILTFKIKDMNTGKDVLRTMTITGVVVGHHHILTSSAPFRNMENIAQIQIAVPDYESMQHKFVTKGTVVAKSNSGLLLLKTTNTFTSSVTISGDDGPQVNDTIRTVDVLNGAIPGVSHAGTISFTMQDKKKFRFLLIDVSSSSSSMGCGVYDDRGDLIALVLGPSVGEGTINFSTVNAIAAKDIRAFLDAYDVNYVVTHYVSIEKANKSRK